MTRPRLIHLLGGGPWQMPTVRLAKSLGYRVLVTDMFECRPAYALADLHEVVDITDMQATLAAARRHRVDAVLCDTTDVGVPTAAFVAEQLGLPGIGFETALNFTNKARMRTLVRSAGLASPAHRCVQSATEAFAAAEELGWPLVIKPVDNQSGRGVGVVRELSALGPAVAAAFSFSRSGCVLLEQHIKGTEVIVDGFVIDGDPSVLAIGQKTPYRDNPTVASRISYPASGTGLPLARIADASRALVRAMGLRNGIFHTEYIVAGDTVFPIDAAARGGGVMIYTHVLPHVCGVVAASAMLDFALGAALNVTPRAVPLAANVEFFRMPAGTFYEVVGAEAALAIQGIAALHINVRAGDTIGPLEHKDKRPGFLVALAETADHAIEISLTAKALLWVSMQGAGPVPVH